MPPHKTVYRAMIEDPSEPEIRVEFTDGTETYLDWPRRSWRELLMFVNRGEINLRDIAQKLVNDPEEVPMPRSLRANLIRLAHSLPKGEERTALLNLVASDKQAILLPDEGSDNSWGAGYYPLPPKLHHLGQFADMFRKPLEHKVFPSAQGNTHMLTVPANTRFSIFGEDLKTLLRLGLQRIQANDPGKISFYFLADAEPAFSNPRLEQGLRSAR